MSLSHRGCCDWKGNVNRRQSVETDEARVVTWWHLVESLGGRLHEYFTQVTDVIDDQYVH